jgi:hypothetical protein
MRQSRDIVAQITEEESFSYIDLKPKPKQQEEVFIADSPENAQQKLDVFAELHNKERMVYAGHLPELFELIGEQAYVKMGSTLQQIVTSHNKN